jgi:hypothetical protein
MDLRALFMEPLAADAKRPTAVEGRLGSEAFRLPSESRCKSLLGLRCAARWQTREYAPQLVPKLCAGV